MTEEKARATLTDTAELTNAANKLSAELELATKRLTGLEAIIAAAIIKRLFALQIGIIVAIEELQECQKKNQG